MDQLARPFSRRRFIQSTLLLASLGPLGGCQVSPSEAEKPKLLRRVTFVAIAGAPLSLEAFRRELRDLGYAEEDNLTLEWRLADGKPERLAEILAELVRAPVEVIVAAGETEARAATRATITIPVILARSVDPIGQGLVATLARPIGNVTGVTIVQRELSLKRLELLKQASPNISRLGIVWNAGNWDTADQVREVHTAAKVLRIETHPIGISENLDLDSAFLAAARSGVDGLTVVTDPLISSHRARIVELAAQHRLPTMHDEHDSVHAGGLMSYAPSLSDMNRRAARYVDRILKGGNPADLPLEQPAFEFVLNVQTAAALGLTISPALLSQATELIH